MFLIRRKADGKWWRNLSYHSKYGKEHWSDSPDGIKPFEFAEHFKLRGVRVYNPHK